MFSKTKSQINQADITRICKNLYGKDCVISNVRELTEGCYNVSYLLHVNTLNCDIFLKVGPPTDAEVLSYEKDIIKTEVMVYECLGINDALPIPKLLHYNFKCDIIDFPYFITERLYGSPLNTILSIDDAGRKNINLQIAKYLAYIHRYKGQEFGYPNQDRNNQNQPYKVVFRDMVEAVIKDGYKKSVELPVDIETFMMLLDSHLSVLDAVKVPVLVHFDLWDGNIFVKNVNEVPTVEGLIDFERCFYGDRIADFVQVSFYIDLEKDTYFIDAYNRYSDEPIVCNKEMAVRVLLHKIYLFLIMIIETAYRDIDGSFNEQFVWASGELPKLIEQLKEMKY